MKVPVLRSAALVLSVFVVVSSSRARQADFNDIGRTVAVMLQDGHLTGLAFSKETNQRFLEDYLRQLDPNRVYFTRQDVDLLHSRYDESFFRALFQKKATEVSGDIFSLFRARVESRGETARQYLKQVPNFTGTETAALSRKDASWPADEADANRLFLSQVKDAVLSEILTRELQVKMAAAQGKPDPTRNELPPREKIALRYERYLRTVKDTTPEDMVGTLLEAIAQSYDPHTDYMIERDASRFTDSMRNQLDGIGAELESEDDGGTRITGIIVGGPADREGNLQLNDRILGVDSANSGTFTDVRFMDRDKVVDLVHGKAGMIVRLKVQPAANAPGDTRIVAIARGRVDIKDAQASAGIIESKGPESGVPHRIGWITLPSFYADLEDGKTRCSVDVEKLLRKLTDEKIDGLIFDVRDNPGGSVDEVCRITGFFTGKGPVVQEKGKHGRVETQGSTVAKPLYTGPMVVLTNQGSASASEIFAGALQDYNRAVVVGEGSTYGKGTVQETEDLASSGNLPMFGGHDGAGMLKVTIQKFYRPTGSSTQLDGVASDIVLPAPPDTSTDDGLERTQRHAFPHDRISAAAGFNPPGRSSLYLPRLRELSAKRIAEDKDFAYFKEDTARDAAEQRKNLVSLNIDQRRKQSEEEDARLTARNDERRERFKAIAEQDARTLRLTKITLDDIARGAGFHTYDPAKEIEDYVRRTKDPIEELNVTPEWPSGLDPIKREGLMVVRDLADLTAGQKIAGIAPKEAPAVH